MTASPNPKITRGLDDHLPISGKGCRKPNWCKKNMHNRNLLYCWHFNSETRTLKGVSGVGHDEAKSGWVMLLWLHYSKNGPMTET
ncbi:hypothetical protein Y032_0345g3100 [Ancylostoma ceylanicum]|uniref:Uncharacterized protein n=1 Tax=Ancylostoma ceylanicum TaxID=53326 RepID=A0A016RXF1_9BILA|nr:hypothetical protein Y032_0345g3100 [Ancylostoma ceylanicum]